MMNKKQFKIKAMAIVLHLEYALRAMDDILDYKDGKYASDSIAINELIKDLNSELKEINNETGKKTD